MLGVICSGVHEREVRRSEGEVMGLKDDQDDTVLFEKSIGEDVAFDRFANLSLFNSVLVGSERGQLDGYDIRVATYMRPAIAR